MQRLLLLALAMLLIPACASTGNGSSGYGYQEKQISELRYRIAYRDRSDDLAAAMDEVLLRAAQLTLREGYDWFDVVDRQSGYLDRRGSRYPEAGYGPDRVVRRDCGLLTCSTRVYEVEDDPFDDNMFPDREEAYAVIEIRLGKGIKPASADAYDARQVAATL